MRRWLSLSLKTLMAASLAGGLSCGGDSAGTGGGGGDGGDGGTGGTAGTGGTGGTGGASGPVTFTVEIENLSAASTLPTPFAPGAWAVATGDNPLWQSMMMEAGVGLEPLAEDGDPSALAAFADGEMSVAASGAFDTPVGAGAPAPILPGQTYSFEIEAMPGDGGLFLATMLVHSNDLFVGPMSEPIALFDDDGTALPSRDVTAELALWDAGTERNQAPGAGPDQAPRQMAANTGASEIGVAAFHGSTRALPSADRIAAVSVSESGGTYTITLANVSDTGGAALTPVAPIFWALHDDSWALFSEGETASAGLEELAEDGSPAGLVAEHDAAAGVSMVGAQTTTVERPADPAGPAMPGEHFSFSVTPSASHPRLSFAAMVVQSNDAFLAPSPGGVALLDDAGMPIAAAEVADAVARHLAIWDAGSEANEVPGVGANQAPRQAGPNTGAADPIDGVRLYLDDTNDLDAAVIGELVSVSVAPGAMAGELDVTLTNTSDSTAYPTPLTPVVWALHAGGFGLFAMGEPASAALERLAEDGDPAPLAAQLASEMMVGDSGVMAIPNGEMDPGPLHPGQSYTFTVTPEATARFLSIATMVVQSTDTLISLTAGGVAIADDTGAPHVPATIDADLAAALLAIDAGTEANQIGGAGPDQPLRQSAPDTGPAEGNGQVRLFDDPIWSYPPVSDLLRVTIR